MLFSRHKSTMVDPARALPGHETPTFAVPTTHSVLGTPLQPPFPKGMETAYLALGCFWGAERSFWELPGVYTTASGYQGGYTPNPTYEEVCTGRTGHAETVMVVFDPARVSYEEILRHYFEAHDPTQGMRQGADTGTQYRSVIFTINPAQKRIAEELRDTYTAALNEQGYGPVTTEIAPAGPFYYAEGYHQQYLHKNPDGYCELEGTGVSCPIGLGVPAVSGGADTEEALPASEEEWRQRLAPDQYAVLRQAATEPPFTGKYVDVDDDGVYRCAACGNELFDSETKFYSTCGWPSFTQALPGAVEYREDRSHGMVRTEVRCARCHSHLGHVFDDGPREAGGQRYCMNSIALNLVER